MKKKTLPNKLSALLRLAVADAKKIATDKRYKLNMCQWHMPANGKCHVCMAGAVMARRGLKPTVDYCESQADFSLSDRRKFDAIDDARHGDIAAAVNSVLGREWFLPCGEAGDRAGALIQKHFKSQRGRAHWHIYLKAADILEKAGL